MFTAGQTLTAIASGAFGLLCWFVAISDHLYRLGLPRTPRSAHYDRRGWVVAYIGCIGVSVFLAFVLAIAWAATQRPH